jgi:PAS domain S-box-containing protein
MRSPLSVIEELAPALGPVERAQIVASTAVIVTMITIIAAMIATGQHVRLMDFTAILAVGIIGFTSVYFSLQYARQLDEQRQQLVALNAVAESVNREVVLDHVLQTALLKAAELLNTQFGWIYMLEGTELRLRSSRGTDIDFLSLPSQRDTPSSAWLHQPRVEREKLSDTNGRIDRALRDLGIQFWVTIPLRGKDLVTGIMVVAGNEYDMFTSKEAEVMEAFGNQISVALHNAQLFERLKQSERQYADLYENAPDIYLTVDHGHRIVACNQMGAHLLGMAKEDIVGQSFERLFVEDRRDALHTALEQMFAQGHELRTGEEQILMNDGGRMYVSLNSSLVVDQLGKSTTARIVARDISERKMMEAALLHAQKIDSIGNLAGGVAHDFNNILASILGAASIIRRRSSPKTSLGKYVEIIENASRRGSSLTRQLLTFARKTETFTKPVNVNAIIQETIQLFERSVSKEITAMVDLTPDVVQVYGDEGQIQQALLNLFLNARDAMPNGGVLSVRSRVVSVDAHTPSGFLSFKPGRYVLITVSDTGSGIPRDDQNRIFEPFFTTKDQGTGLGLSVFYGVIQSHAGFFDLESEIGEGTTFSIYLPEARVQAPPAVRRRPQRPPRGRENILVVDDEQSVCQVAHDMLSDLGYTVTFVNDGREGVDFYRTRQGSVDLILLDMNMPVMGGREAFEQLRRINPTIRIIIMTGYGKGILEEPTFSSEVNGFIQKPFELEELALKVRQALDRRAATTEHDA